MYSKIITKAKKKIEEMEPVEKVSEYAMDVMKPTEEKKEGKKDKKKEDLIELEMMVKAAKQKK